MTSVDAETATVKLTGLNNPYTDPEIVYLALQEVTIYRELPLCGSGRRPT